MTLTRPITNDSRQLTVTHTTRFNYNQPVEHSKHCVHLRPIDDAYQRVVSFRLEPLPSSRLWSFKMSSVIGPDDSKSLSHTRASHSWLILQFFWLASIRSILHVRRSVLLFH